jgi:hypothetical protein
VSTAALPTRTVEGPDTVLRDEIRTTGMVWLRELIRFERTRTRILSGLIQPIFVPDRDGLRDVGARGQRRWL